MLTLATNIIGDSALECPDSPPDSPTGSEKSAHPPFYTPKPPTPTTLVPTPPSTITYVRKNLYHPTEQERELILKKTEYNVFNFPGGMVTVDLLSDSGTSALYQEMWGAMMMSDESYARNSWYYALLDAFRDFTQRGDSPRRVYMNLLDPTRSGMQLYQELVNVKVAPGSFVDSGIQQLSTPNAFITPQGRCCENLLFNSIKVIRKEKELKEIEMAPAFRRMGTMASKPLTTHKIGVVVSNGLFDTTRANCEIQGFQGINLFHPDLNKGTFPMHKLGLINLFHGDIDLRALKELLGDQSKEILIIIITMTNNTGGGQPVSMNCLKQVFELSRIHSIPLWIDACRVNENAAFIKQYERGYSRISIPAILKEIFSYADGFHSSLKKAAANMGGFISFKNDGLIPKCFPKIGSLMKREQIITYGNDSYGGMSGRDLAAATVSLYVSITEEYLYPRIKQSLYLGKKLAEAGLPVVLPIGGHAVFIDVNRMFLNRNWYDFAGVGLVIQLLIKYGIRACELGYMAWELDKYVDSHDGNFPDQMPPNLVRMAIPANVYSKEHMDYVAECLIQLNDQKHLVPNARIIRAKNANLRHFIVGVEPVQP